MKLKQFLAFLTLSILAFASTAQSLRVGIDYDLLEPPVPVSAKPGQVDVVEFFSYMCPHCAHFEPVIENWLKTAPKQAAFRRMPVVFRPQWEAPAKLYLTLKILNRLDLQPAVFNAIHNEGKDLTTEAGITDWVVGRGIERQKFTDIYRSFGVQTELNAAAKAMQDNHIDGVPKLVVGGKYIVPGENFKGDFAAMLKVVDALVTQNRKKAKTGGKSKN